MAEKTKKKLKSIVKRPKKDKEPKERRGFVFTPRFGFVLLSVAAVAFLIYSVISIAGINAKIRERKQELSEIQHKITVQEIKNEDMNRTYNLSESERSDYIEQIARDDLDYLKQGERVFVNVSGD